MNRIILFLLVLTANQTFAQTTQFYPIEVKGKWGYMNTIGKMVIPAQYDLAEDFNEDLAVVALNNLPCVINTKNMRVIDTGLYSNISMFSEGLSYVRDFTNHKFYVDTKGKKIITLSDSIYDARPFKSGVAVVGMQYDKHETKFEVDISTISFRFAYIDKKGNFVTDFKFDDADDMQQGLARIKKGTLFGLIDSAGNYIIKPSFALLDMFFEDKAAYSINGRWGYIDTKGNVAASPQFDLALDFNEGVAGVLLNGKYGFIDTKGNVIIKPEYEQIRAFSEGKAAVMKNGKWGFINVKGEVVIPFNFDNASVFSEGYCAVLVKRYWGFINSNGNIAVSAEFDAVGSFENGVADVVYHNISLYVNKQGNILPNLNK